jgi:glycosyltransferase involved in cell wall biosynthesis
VNSEQTTRDVGRFHIALGVPEWEPLSQVMNGQPADATYVIQGNLSRGLMARGHALTFVAPNGLDEFIFTPDPQDPQVAPRTWSASPLFDLTSKAAWRAQQLLGIPYLNVFSNYRFFDACLQSLKNTDVVYERNGLYNSGLAMAARRLQIPYMIFFEADQIMELDIMNRPIKGALRWRAMQLLRFNLDAADCIICVTEAGRRHLVNKWNIPAKKIVVFPNAVYVDRFKPDLAARAQVRAALGLGEEPVILFVGNFFHWHDVATLLKAFARCLHACPDARLVLVGDGERRAEMMQQAADLGLDHAVQFTGIVPHSTVPQYMAAADVAVVPYPPMEQEMWLSPLKLFEYMSSGVTVVASAIGQIIDVIQDGENGLLVPPGDVSAMAEALVKTVNDPSLRSKLGSQAREDAVQKYSWESYLSRLERIFTAVIARQPVDSL